MREPIRVLNITRVFQAAGIESFIMNMYRNIDRDKVQFDFLVMKDEKGCYDDEIDGLGGKRYYIDVKPKNTFIRIIHESIKLYKFLKKNKYQIIHVHYTTPLRAPYLLAAKKAGVPVRIYHSHSAEVSGKSGMKLKIYNFFRKKITQWGTDWFACSNAAAEWMYEKKLIENNKVKVICNGIDTNKFGFCQADRDAVREEYGVEDKFIIIHTGRFLEQKNHKFILDVFNKVKDKCSSAVLMLLGTGPLIDEIKHKAKVLGIEESVFFLGVHSDVNRFLSAADCYIMPSLYEGLPVAAIEAQCAGLPCVFSDNITSEVMVTENVSFLSLNSDIEKWCETIVGSQNVIRKDCIVSIIEHGYDVCNVAEALQDFYEKAFRSG